MKRRFHINLQPSITPTEYHIPENDISAIDVQGLSDYDPKFIPKHIIENVLEAVIIPLTSREIESSRFDFFMENMLDTIEENKGIILIFFVNNDKYKNSTTYIKFSEYVLKVKPFFNSVHVVNANIDFKDDIYSLNPLDILPKYGLVSGPNLLFLHAMHHCKRFNTVLLLETDCILTKGWLSKCVNYVKYTGYFLISGSTYDGCVDIFYDPSFPEKSLHINGVGFYNTGNTIFQQVIKELDKYLIYYANNVSPINAYDYVLSYMIFKNLMLQKNFKYWRYVYRNITKNSLIINCSLSLDKDGTNKDKIYSIFPSCVILHKKL